MIHLNTKEFVFHKDTNTFVAEALMLEGEHPTFFDHQQVELQSERTRACKTFTFQRTVTDNDSDILYWEYKSEDNLIIKVMND